MLKHSRIIFCVFGLIIAFSGYAQNHYDFINQFTYSQKLSYSKSIELLSYSNVGNLINQGNGLTIMLQDNDFFNRLSAMENNSLFVLHDINAINLFLNSYTVNGIWDQPSISAGINTNGKVLEINSLSGKPIQVSRHLNTFLIVQPNAFEANVLGSQHIAQTVFLFL